MNIRILYFDRLKLFAIYLVILGHYLFYIHSGLLSSLTYQIIYTFHMPLFIIISGYFSQNFKTPFLLFSKRKTQSLLLPVLTWTLIITLYSLCTDRPEKRIVAELIGNSWFLKVLFVSQMAFWFLLKTPFSDGILCAVSVLISFLLPLGTTFQFNFMFSFFWVGYFLRKRDSQLDRNNQKILITSGLVFFSILVIMLYNQWDFTNLVMSYDTWNNSLYLIIAKYLAGLSGSLFFISLFKKFSKESHKQNFLSDWGRYTLGIYVMQTLIIQYVFEDLYRHLFKYFASNNIIVNYCLTLVISALTCMLCVCLIKKTSKNKWMNIVLYGGQY